MTRMDPLPPGEPAELADTFQISVDMVGLVTNNLRVMARKPDIVKHFAGLAAAVLGDGEVSKELKFLVGYLASFSAGCMYCTAHAGVAASKLGETNAKTEAIWDYETSPLFSDAERAALRVAQLSGQVPNGVTDEDFAALKEHFSDTQIVEIVSAISIYGYLNRFNDTMAMPLEAQTIENAEARIKAAGWQIGKHEPL